MASRARGDAVRAAELAGAEKATRKRSIKIWGRANASPGIARAENATVSADVAALAFELALAEIPPTPPGARHTMAWCGI